MAERGSCESGRQSCRELELIPDSVCAVQVEVEVEVRIKIALVVT